MPKADRQRHREGEQPLPERIRKHPVALTIGLVFVIVTGVVAFAQSSATIMGWLAPYWPYASRLADERVVEDLSAGVDLSVFERQLGAHTFRSADGPYTEYVFERPNCYVQAIVDHDEQVLLFAVTSRNREFHPVFNPPGLDNGFVNRVELGVTTFSEWAEPDWIRGWFGASWMHYAETIKLPHADNFLGVVVASSDAGHYFETRGDRGVIGDDYPDSLNDAIVANNASASAIRWYREGTPINTYGEVAPSFDAAELYDEDGFPKYKIVIGPDRVRVGSTVY